MILENPIFVRFKRSRLRFKKAAIWYLLTLIASAFTVTITYLESKNVEGLSSVDAARTGFIPLIVIQGFILLFMGTGSVASGIAQDKVEDVLNYQRLTPLSRHQKILGYLFGLPIREYALFAITIPFLIFVLWKGEIPFSAWAPFYMIFATSTVLYHLTGFSAGMVSKGWKFSARMSQIFVVLLYFALPQLSHLGIIFLEYLTVRPVFAEQLRAVINPSTQVQVGNGPFGVYFPEGVPFFNLSVSGTIFSFIVQVLLAVFLYSVISRKWLSQDVPSIGKKGGIIAYAVFVFITVGNLWPNIIRSENALPFFQSNQDFAPLLAILSIPLVFSMVTMLFAFTLLASMAPDPLLYNKGIIRRKYLNLKHISLFSDEASSYKSASFIIVIQAVTLALVYRLIDSAGYLEGSEIQYLNGIWLIIACAGTMYLYIGSKELLGGKQLLVLSVLTWVLPALVGVVIFAASNSANAVGFVIMSISPIVNIFLAALHPIPNEELVLYEMDVLISSKFSGALFLAVSNAIVHVMLARKRRWN